jgi:hypothetical protein
VKKLRIVVTVYAGTVLSAILPELAADVETTLGGLRSAVETLASSGACVCVSICVCRVCCVCCVCVCCVSMYACCVYVLCVRVCLVCMCVCVLCMCVYVCVCG